jgi:hypothetical protein
MPIDMIIKFGYCVLCDNGPDRKSREWVTDLLNSRATKSHTMTTCKGCEAQPNNQNLLSLEVNVPDRKTNNG